MRQNWGGLKCTIRLNEERHVQLEIFTKERTLDNLSYLPDLLWFDGEFELKRAH